MGSGSKKSDGGSGWNSPLAAIRRKFSRMPVGLRRNTRDVLKDSLRAVKSDDAHLTPDASQDVIGGVRDVAERFGIDPTTHGIHGQKADWTRHPEALSVVAGFRDLVRANLETLAGLSVDFKTQINALPDDAPTRLRSTMKDMLSTALVLEEIFRKTDNRRGTASSASNQAAEPAMDDAAPETPAASPPAESHFTLAADAEEILAQLEQQTGRERDELLSALVRRYGAKHLKKPA